MKAIHSLLRSRPSAAVVILAGFALSACSGLRSEIGGIFGGGEQPSISVAGEEPAPEIVETEVSATFDASASGSVCSSGVVFDGQPPQPIGESGEDYGPNYAPNTESCTGFWTFSLPNLSHLSPTVTVTGATFAPGECHLYNDPFKGNSTLQFDGVDVGPTLEAGDIPYASLANLGNWANCPFPMDVTAFVQSRVTAGASSVQFGAYMTFPQFGDGQESNVWFANDAWNVPTLTIRYYPTFSVPAPSITYPLAGAVCSTDITITGKAPIGAFVVDLSYDGGYSATSTVSDQGDWDVPDTFSPGAHTVMAKARSTVFGTESQPVEVKFTVDPARPAGTCR